MTLRIDHRETEQGTLVELHGWLGEEMLPELRSVCESSRALVDIGANPGKTVQSYRVADRDTRELIDAETAVWVMGGRKRGVMTPVPKWAFGSTPAAESFVREYGGQVVPWTAVLDAARKELERKSR